MTTDRRFRPVVLCVLDGWGHRPDAENNAIALADTPVWDRLMASEPHSLIEASSDDVGLPAGQMGNSEVGHMSLGAGRIVLQDLPRIDRALADGSLSANPVLGDLVARLGESGGACHLMGLMSPGGVHSHQKHMAAVAREIAGRGVPVRVHAFLDGRDTPPSSARGFLDRFAADIAGVEGIAIATVSGRYYAMDRDRRWERVSRAYEAMVAAGGETAADAHAALAAAHDRGETDEFVTPTVIDGYAGMADGDGVLMANFRADRAREIVAALVDPDFDGFARARVVRFAAAGGMTGYSAGLNRFLTTLFPAVGLEGTLGEVVAGAGRTQLRIAETEKYAHVTFFFNGGEEAPFPGEERILVPSPKVATYDLKPEMSAYEVTDRLVGEIGAGRFDLIVANYANGDMVGHTGDLDATIRAVEAVDACLGRLVEAVAGAGGALIITADHGNAEKMHDGETAQPHTAHTSNPVPFVLACTGSAATKLRDGRLADVAPTVLALMGLPRPREMTGVSLLEIGSANVARQARAERVAG